MNTHDALRARRTIHSFTSAPVPPDVVTRALEAAHLAPCHRATWPWRFVLLGPETRASLAEITIAAKSRKHPLTEPERKALRARHLTPPVAILIACAIDPRPIVHAEDLAATAAATENLLLSFTADGFGTKWVTGGTLQDDATWSLVGLDRSQHALVALVWAGEAAAVPTIQRPPLADHVVLTP